MARTVGVAMQLWMSGLSLAAGMQVPLQHHESVELPIRGPGEPHFGTTFNEELVKAHAAARQSSRRSGSPRAGTVNIAISLTEDELPSWCQAIMNGEWGRGVSLTVYIKTKGLHNDQEKVLESRDRFEKIAIPDIGRNEHAYVWHLARTYEADTDVQILTKTNGVDEQMMKFLVNVSMRGTYGFVSHPWLHRRRYLNVRCLSDWKDHPLFDEFCGKDHRPYGSTFMSKHLKEGMFVVKQSGVRAHGDSDLSWPLRSLPRPLPLLHETYGEGIFAIRRDVLQQRPESWYQEWKSRTYGNGSHPVFDGKHHDRAMIELFPLLFSLEDGLAKFPAWHVSPSTVELF